MPTQGLTFEERFGFSEHYEMTVPEVIGSETEGEDDRWQVTKGLSAGVDQTQGMLYGLTGVIGDLVGSDSVRDWGLEGYQSNMKEAQKSEARISSYDQVESVGDAFDYVMYGLGNTLPMFVPSLATGGVGAIAARKSAEIAVKKLLKARIDKGLSGGLTEAAAARLAAREMTEKATKKIVGKAVSKGNSLGAFAGSAGIGMGNIYGDIYEQTGEHRAGVAVVAGTLSGAFDGLPIAAVLNRMGMKKAKDEIVGQVMDGAGTFIGKQILKESSTEAVQTVIERAAIQWVDSNKKVFTEDGWKEITNAAILGGIAGGAFSAPFAPKGSSEANKERIEQLKRKKQTDSVLSEVNKPLEDIIGGDIDDTTGGEPVFDDYESLKGQADPLANNSDRKKEELEELIRADLGEYNQLGSWDNDTEYLDLPDQENQTKARNLRNGIIAANEELNNLSTLTVPTMAQFENSGTDESIDLFNSQKEFNVDQELAAIDERKEEQRLAITNESIGYSSRPDSDSQQFAEVPLHTAIRNSGGLNIAEAELDGLDPSVRKAINSDSDNVGKPLFSPNGLSTDAMRETLDQYGWDFSIIDPSIVVDNAIESMNDQSDIHPMAIEWKGLQTEVNEQFNSKISKAKLFDIFEDYSNGKEQSPKDKQIAQFMADSQLEHVEYEQNQGVIDSEPDTIYDEDHLDWFTAQHKNAYNLIRKAAEIDPEKAKQVMADWEQNKITDLQVSNELTKFIGINNEKADERIDSKPVEADSSESNQGRNEIESKGKDDKTEVTPVLPKKIVKLDDNNSHTKKEIETLANETNVDPSEAQIEANNYKKGRVKIHGLDIAIENPKGSTRSGIDPNGEKWSNTMNHHYGDISRTLGADGDAVDVFIGNNPESSKVFIVDQVKANGHFDEHKVMLGFNTQSSAVLGYKSNYSKGWKVGKTTEMSVTEFKDWLKNGDTTKKAGTHDPVKHQSSNFSKKDNVYYYADYYVDQNARELSHQLKNKSKQAENEIALKLAKIIPKGMVIIPTPSRKGEPTNTLRIANHIARIRSDITVNNILSGDSRESVYDLKKQGKKANSDFFGFKSSGKIKKNSILLDGVYDTGVTINSIREVTGDIPAIVFAKVETAKEQTAQPSAKKDKSNYGASNKLVSKDRADEIRKKLKAKLSQLNSGIDPELMSMGAELAVFHIEAGSRKFTEFAKAMVNDLGDNVVPYLRSWYEGARYYPGNDAENMSKPDSIPTKQTEIEALINEPSESRDLAQDSNERADKEPLGAESNENESNPSNRNAERSSRNASEQGGKQQSDPGLPVDGATASGKIRNSDIFGESGKFGTGGNDSTTTNSSRSGGSIDLRLKPKPKREERSSSDVAGNDLTFKEKVKQQKAISSKPKQANQADIIETLPVLLDTQHEDVFKAEKRFLKGQGMMFTNGTGTGKTFVGLGIAKRFALDGKKNILFLAPTAPKVDDWINDGKHLGLDIGKIKDIKSSGSGFSITTYANFGDNRDILNRQFDLIIADESHYFSKNAKGDETKPLDMLRAVTNHHSGTSKKANFKYAEDFEKVEKLKADFIHSNSYRFDSYAEVEREADKQYEPDMAIIYDKVRAYQKTLKPLDTKVAFLSATPFAYAKSLDYVNGYLFDYNVEKDSNGGYNQANGRQDFYIENFGYRMKYGKLTQPESDVDIGLMERRMHQTLVDSGALSGRKLILDNDYSRDFVIVNDSIGGKIDEGLSWLRDQEDPSVDEDGNPAFDHKGEQSTDNPYKELVKDLQNRFNYLEQRKLLESVKAKHAVDRIKKHLALGRKVILFHDYNIGGAEHPFKFTGDNAVIKRFEKERPDLVNLDLSGLIPATTTIENAFGSNVQFFSGKTSVKNRIESIKKFNDPDSDLDVIMIQADAGREGISLHDTKGLEGGGKQRVLISLGMPNKPVDSTQIEGRGYRFGLKSDFPIEYLTTGARFEEWTFGNTISSRASTAENLAMGSQARDLARAFKEGYLDASSFDPHADQGVGGKLNDKANFDSDPFTVAISDYFTNQKRTSKNKGQDGADYFATPEPLGFKMVEWLGLQPNDSFLEPSAGHGAIARYAPEDVNKTFVEPSYTLQPKLRMNAGEGKIVESDFESFNIINKFDGIAMNPPFGKGGKLAMEHIDKASKHLNNGGRIVAIIPRGQMDARLDRWLEDNEGMQLRESIDLPSVTFKRAGTNVSTRVIILDKVVLSKKTEFYITDFIFNSNNPTSDLEAGTIKDFFSALKNVKVISPINRSLLKEANEVEPSLAPVLANDNFKLAEFKDSRDASDLFVAQVIPSLGDQFKAVSGIARSQGGRYSRYQNKETGAIRGFLFKTQMERSNFIAKAEQFMDFDGVNENNSLYAVNESKDEYIEVGRSIQRDMFATPKISKYEKLEQLKDIYNVQVSSKPVRQLSSSIEYVKSAQDVPLLLADIKDKAQETFMAIVTSDTGKVLRVISHSSGVKTASIVDPITITAEIASVAGAKFVHFAHNHPSGNLTPSTSDISTTKELIKWLDGTGIRMQSHVIVTPSKSGLGYGEAVEFSDLNSSGSIFYYSMDEKRDKLIDLTERFIDKNNVNTFITSPASTKAAVQSVKSDNFIILLDNSNGIAGIVFLNKDEMKILRDNGSINRLMKGINATNASGMIIVTNSQAAAENVSMFFNRDKSVRLLDWIRRQQDGTLLSDAEYGGKSISKEGVFFRKGTATERTLTTEQVHDFSEEIKSTFKSAPVSVVQREVDLPANIQAEIAKRGSKGEVKGLFANGTIYIVGENHKTIADMHRTALHETVGHYGLKEWLGKGHSAFIDKVYSSMSKNDVKSIAKRHGIQKGIDYKTIVAEEYIAEMAEENKNPTVMDKIIAWFKDALQSIFPNIKLSDSQIRIALSNARKMLSNTSKPLSDIVLTREIIKNGEKVTLQGSADKILRVARKKLDIANNLLRCVNNA